MFNLKKSSLSAMFAGVSVAAISLAGSLPALAVQESGAANAPVNQSLPDPSVIVFSQKAAGSAIDLTYVYVPKKSFVVIHDSDANGGPGKAVLGTVAVEPGSHNNLKINLTSAPKPGAKLWVSLNEDKGANGTFDMKTDASYWASNDMPLSNSFTLL